MGVFDATLRVTGTNQALTKEANPEETQPGKFETVTELETASNTERGANGRVGDQASSPDRKSVV